MVTAPEARRCSPAAAVSWQQSWQPGCDQPSGPSPAVNPFVPLARVGSLRRRLVTGGLIINDQVGMISKWRPLLRKYLPVTCAATRTTSRHGRSDSTASGTRLTSARKTVAAWIRLYPGMQRKPGRSPPGEVSSAMATGRKPAARGSKQPSPAVPARSPLRPKRKPGPAVRSHRM